MTVCGKYGQFPLWGCFARPSLQQRLWVSLPSVTEKLLYCTEIRWMTWQFKNISFLCSKKSWFALSICSVKCPIHLRIHPDTPIRSRINEQLWLCCIYSHTCSCHKTPSTMFDTWCGLLWIISCSFILHSFLFTSFWHKCILVSSLKGSSCCWMSSVL